MYVYVIYEKQYVAYEIDSTEVLKVFSKAGDALFHCRQLQEQNTEESIDYSFEEFEVV